ncbi:hypothetical protein ABT115_04500 [Streptomyces sp. NPDC001832]|uniref:hypothetical protein n=1 Tax=Streptomyces sp. NPDC001832 TaxID=3154527 RepID=UPI003325E689
MVKHLHHELLLDGAAADYDGGTLGWRARGGRFARSRRDGRAHPTERRRVRRLHGVGQAVPSDATGERPVGDALLIPPDRG